MAKKSSKLKGIIACLLAATVVAGGVIGGSLAYLQDEDSDVNVMTLGNVQIEQHEYQRAENEDGSYKTDTIDDKTSYVLEAFEQDKMLHPIVGDPSTGEAGWDSQEVRMSQVDSYGGMQVFAGKVAQDKFVTVENTGASDAYVRTLVAIEIGSTDGSLIGTSYHKTWTKTGPVQVTIDDKSYNLYEYIYAGAKNDDGTWLRHNNGILPAGDTSYPNLSQVYLKSEATNEDMTKLDGNGDGKLDVLVLSQAVQVSGFDNAKQALDTAFGAVSQDKAQEWFGTTNPDGVLANKPARASTQEELKTAIDEGKNVILEKGTYTFPAGLKEGMTLECADGVVFTGTSSLNIDGATVVGATFSNPSGTVVSQTIDGTFKNCTFTGSNGLRWCYAGETVVFENCVFDGSLYGVHFDGGANDILFKNCTFSGFNAMPSAATKLTLENCTFKANDRSGYNGINLWGDTDLINCTFVFDGTKTEWVDLLGNNKTVNFTNCKVSNGKTIAEVVGDYGTGNTIVIDGVTLTK